MSGFRRLPSRSDPGRVSTRRLRTDRSDRRLPRRPRRPAHRARCRARRCAGDAAPTPAHRARAVDGRDRRRGTDHRAHDHPLAAPELVRLLPGEHLVLVDPRRIAVGWARRPGHELDHLAGVHGGRDADARLDAGTARPPRSLPLDERARRWRDPGFGERGIPGGDPRSSLARHRRRREPHRRHEPFDRVLHVAGPLVDREGSPDRRDRDRPDPGRRSRRRVRDAPRLARGRDRDRSPRRIRPVLRLLDTWDHVVDGVRPDTCDRRHL